MDNKRESMGNSGTKATPTDTQRTGPGTGNQRGNDLRSEGGTQKDGRRIEGATGTPNTRSNPGQQDARDLKERKDDAQATPGRDAPAKRGQPADTSEETAGTERHPDDGD